MTTRIIQSLSALEMLAYSLPDFVQTLEGQVNEVVTVYQELEAMYQERAEDALKEYERSMEGISGLLDCSHSERCGCASEYESRARAYEQQYQSVLHTLDAIIDPVKSRMNTTSMFDSYQTCVTEHERYADGLQNLVQVARDYLQA